MDIVQYVRMHHNVDIMHSLLFSQLQQLLLKFQRRLVLDSDSELSDNDWVLARKSQKSILAMDD